MSDIPEAVTARPPTSGASLWERIRRHPLARVGPGLITGAADDDPSGIATYSQAGAQFGLNMLWTMPLAYPLMSAIQCMCGFLGRTTGKGLAANIKAAFPPAVLQIVVLRCWWPIRSTSPRTSRPWARPRSWSFASTVI